MGDVQPNAYGGCSTQKKNEEEEEEAHMGQTVSPTYYCIP